MEEQAPKKLFLLDAYALIFRAYYAFISNPMYNAEGLNTSAVFGFTNALEDVLAREKPSHLAIVFDPPGGSFRNNIFPEYKANREATPEDIRKAVPYIKRLAQAYRIPVIEVAGYEADDVIGTLAKKAEQKGYQVFMMTPDKDFSQLVSDRIQIYKPAKGGKEAEKWGVEEVRKKFGIESPEQVIDILALWGDASDNIPGAPGIGEKTSQKLIAEYKSLEGLYSQLDQLKGKQKETLENFRDQVMLSYKLATIDTQVPVDLDEKGLVLEHPDREALRELFNELEFKTLASRILARLSPGVSNNPSPGLFDEIETGPANQNHIGNTEHQYQLRVTPGEINELADDLSKLKEFCFDTETSSLDVYQAELVGISFSWKPGRAYYVPFPPEREKSLEILDVLRKPLENQAIRKIGQNLKYDIQVLENYGIRVAGELFDTMLAHYLLQPEGRHNMNVLAENYLGYSPVPIEALIGEKGKDQGNMRHVPREKICEYACEDADITLQLQRVFEPELEKEGLGELSRSIEMPLITVLAGMERYGMNIRESVLNAYSKELSGEIDKLEESIYEHAGTRFNISSPRQLGEILFDRLKVSDKPRKTRTGQYATNEELLQTLADKHPVIPLILEHRSLKKLLSTYVDALPRMIRPETGRLHTSFNQTITSTGRLSSNNPNLQNIPIRESRGREIRKAFVPSGPDYILLSADYSQIELRLMAHMSRDEAMIEAFRNNEDIHTATAARIHRIAPEKVSREMRGQAKTANFGIIYGISAFGLAQRLHIDRSDARALIDGYFESYPGVKQYMDQSIKQARDEGFVTTLMGRKRHLPDIHSRNAVVRGMAERNAINAPIQGSAADLIKLAMVRIHRKLTEDQFRSAMILQVHDELVFDVYRPELEKIQELVKKEMEGVTSLRVPLVIEMGTGENWLEAH